MWHTPNHWANGETSIRFVKNIILPYISTTLKDLGLGAEHMAVVIFDTFKGHTGSEMESLLLENNIISVIVSSNCTDVLQPLDLSLNKPLKDHLRPVSIMVFRAGVKRNERWKTAREHSVDMKLTVMKPLSAEWIISAYDYLIELRLEMCMWFVEAGICEAVDEAESDSEDDPFADIDEQ